MRLSSLSAAVFFTFVSVPGIVNSLSVGAGVVGALNLRDLQSAAVDPAPSASVADAARFSDVHYATTTAPASSPTPTATELAYNGPTHESTRRLRPLAKRPASSPTRSPLTNAQRLARHIPLPKPRLGPYRGSPSVPQPHPHLNPHLNQPRDSANAPQPSAAPCLRVRGTIRVVEVGTGEEVGFVSRVANVYGEYTLGGSGRSGSAGDSLVVSLPDASCSGDAGAPFEIEALNGLEGQKLFGAVVGIASQSDDLKEGSYNHAYIAGTDSVLSGPAVNAPNGFTSATGISRDVESAIWTLAADGSTLVPNWINADGARADAAHLVYSPDVNAFAITGDPEAFGFAPEVTFMFIPDGPGSAPK